MIENKYVAGGSRVLFENIGSLDIPDNLKIIRDTALKHLT